MATYNTSRYDTLYKDFVKQQNTDAAKQKTETTNEYSKQLKQAYISRMQDQKALNENLASAGIRGGATETSNLKLMTNYQNTRNDLNEQQAKALQDITNNANANIFNYKQQNDAAKISYIEQREAEDRQIAQAKKESDAAIKSDFLAAKYGGYYSVSSLNAAYKKATTTEEKAIIKARINYLTEQSKTKAETKKAETANTNTAFWEAKYGGYYSLDSLTKAYKNAKTTEEKTIIKSRMNYLNQYKKGY